MYPTLPYPTLESMGDDQPLHPALKGSTHRHLAKAGAAGPCK